MSDQNVPSTVQDPVSQWIDRIKSCTKPEALKTTGAEIAREIQTAIDNKEFSDNLGIIKIRAAYVRHRHGDLPTAHDLFHPLIEATKGDHFSFK